MIEIDLPWDLHQAACCFLCAKCENSLFVWREWVEDYSYLEIKLMSAFLQFLLTFGALAATLLV